MSHRVIQLHAAAPPKPAPGQPCNGCGVCCAWAPCPLGMLVSARRHGRCRALQWSGSHYRCGALTDPHRFLAFLRWIPAPWARKLVHRWIGAARGCDALLQAG